MLFICQLIFPVSSINLALKKKKKNQSEQLISVSQLSLLHCVCPYAEQNAFLTSYRAASCLYRSIIRYFCAHRRPWKVLLPMVLWPRQMTHIKTRAMTGRSEILTDRAELALWCSVLRRGGGQFEPFVIFFAYIKKKNFICSLGDDCKQRGVTSFPFFLKMYPLSLSRIHLQTNDYSHILYHQCSCS